MAEISNAEAMFHDAIKGFLGKREQGLVMGHFRAVLSANAGKVDAERRTAEFDKWWIRPGRPADAVITLQREDRPAWETVWNVAWNTALTVPSPTQQASDAGRQG